MLPCRPVQRKVWPPCVVFGDGLVAEGAAFVARQLVVIFGWEIGHAALQVVARVAGEGEHVAVVGGDDADGADVLAEDVFGVALHHRVEGEHNVGTRVHRLGLVDGVEVVAADIDLQQLLLRVAAQRLVVDAFEALAAFHLVGPQPFFLTRFERLRLGFAASDVAEDVAGELALGVHAAGLGVDVDAGNRAEFFDIAGERAVIEVLPGEQRAEAFVGEVALDFLARHGAFEAEGFGDFVEHVLDRVDHIARPLFVLAEFGHVDRDAMAGAVFGEHLAVGVDDPPAQSGLADHAHAVFAAFLLVELMLADLQFPHRDQQIAERHQDQNADDAGAPVVDRFAKGHGRLRREGGRPAALEGRWKMEGGRWRVRCLVGGDANRRRSRSAGLGLRCSAEGALRPMESQAIFYLRSSIFRPQAARA